MWQTLLGPVVNLVGGHLERKGEEKRALHDRKMEAIKQDANWENIHASNAANSWRDEFFSILFKCSAGFTPIMSQGRMTP